MLTILPEDVTGGCQGRFLAVGLIEVKSVSTLPVRNTQGSGSADYHNQF